MLSVMTEQNTNNCDLEASSDPLASRRVAPEGGIPPEAFREASAPPGREQSTKKRSQIVYIACITLMMLLFFAAGILIGAFIIWNDDGTDDNSTKIPNDANPLVKPFINVGAFYYPWHGPNFHDGQGYLREKLEPKQEPFLGEYDDRDPAVISQHLKWSRQANINVWVTSWWGPFLREDNATRKILNHTELGNHQIALFYETFGRLRESEDYSLFPVANDIRHMCEHYFDHPNYFHIDEKPVLVMYLTRKLQDLGILKPVIERIRNAALEACNHSLYIIGDQVFSDPPQKEHEYDDPDEYTEEYAPFDILDGVTTYDFYGSAGGEGGQLQEEEVDTYYQQWMRTWREAAKSRGCSFIPSVTPGYNDLGVRPERNHTPLSRTLAWPRQNDPGSLFKVALKNARSLVDPEIHNLLLVNSFNEWHEDTQIEPTIGSTASLPYIFTYGLEYYGYGDLYLNILYNATQEEEYIF